MGNKRKVVIWGIFSSLLSFVGVLTILLFLPFLDNNVVEGLNIRIFSVWNLLIFVILGLLFFVLFRLVDRIIFRLKIYAMDMEHGVHGYGSIFQGQV